MESEENPFNYKDTTIAISPDGMVVVMTLPIAAYVEDEANGNALIYGKMRELQAHVMQMANAMRTKKNSNGLIMPAGTVPELKVH